MATDDNGSYSWDELASWRWGPAAADPSPGVVIDRPDRARMLAALRAADRNDPYAVAERLAIQAEGVPGASGCGRASGGMVD